MSTTDSKTTSSPMNAQEREIRKMLVTGEDILIMGRLHGALYWKPVAVLIFAFLIYFTIPPFGFLFGMVGVFWLCIAILTKHYLLLAVTSKRILARQGLLQMDVIDIRLSKVESIDLERMLPGHIFGYANVVIMGTGQRLIRVPYVGNADAFRRFFNEMVLSSEGNEAVAKDLKENGETEDKPAKATRASRARKKASDAE